MNETSFRIGKALVTRFVVRPFPFDFSFHSWARIYQLLDSSLSLARLWVTIFVSIATAHWIWKSPPRNGRTEDLAPHATCTFASNLSFSKRNLCHRLCFIFMFRPNLPCVAAAAQWAQGKPFETLIKLLAAPNRMKNGHKLAEHVQPRCTRERLAAECSFLLIWNFLILSAICSERHTGNFKPVPGAQNALITCN